MAFDPSNPNDVKKLRDEVAQLKEEYGELNEKRRSGLKLATDQKERLIELAAQIRENARQLKLVDEATEKYNKAISDTSSLLNDIIPGMGSLTDLLVKQSDGTRDLKLNLSKLGDQMANSFLKSSAAMAKSLESTNVELAKQTGYARALSKDVIALASSQDGLYLSLSDSAKVVGSLSTGFKMYNAQSDETRKRINSLAGRFKVLGVESNVTAEVLDQMNVIFGNMPTSAALAAAELENLSIRTGQPLSVLLDDFKQVGPEMARFGADGIRVFTRLSEKARTLGLTVKQAFDMSELFDTFEGSADVAGKLNAQLGLQLNSVELMSATSEDRLAIVRAEFDLAGVHMQQLDRRNKQMVADILKTDVLTAERLLGDPVALREFQKEEANRQERIKSFTTAMDKFTSAFQQLFINLEPALTYVVSTLGKLAEAMKEAFSTPLGGFLSGVLLVGAALWKANSAAGLLGTSLMFIVRRVLPFLALFQALNDALTAMGYGDVSEREQEAAGRRYGFGMAGAAVGGIGAAALGAKIGAFGGPVGILLGAGLGYGIGSLIAHATDVEDHYQVGNPGTSHLVTPLSAHGVPKGPSVRTHPGDSISAMPRGSAGGSFGSFDEVGKKLDTIASLLANSKMTAVLKLDSKTVAEETFKHANSVHTV